MSKSEAALLDYHKERSRTLYAEVRKLRAEARDAHRAGFEEGCRATTLLSYLAVTDYGLDGIQWLSDRIGAVTAKKPAPHSNEIDEAVTRSVIEHMAKYNPARAAQIEKEFEKFLTGKSAQ